MKYSEKLKDPRWQRRRLEIMERDGFRCICCQDTKSTLVVHHKQYHGNPWDAPSDSLETLCELCHEKRTCLNKAFLSTHSLFAVKIFDFIFMGKYDKKHVEALFAARSAFNSVMSIDTEVNNGTH